MLSGGQYQDQMQIVFDTGMVKLASRGGGGGGAGAPSLWRCRCRSVRSQTKRRLRTVWAPPWRRGT